MSPLIPHSRPTLGEEEAEAARRTVLSGQVAQGEEVAAFESDAARYVGRKHAVAVSSGTAALHVALLINDVGPDSKVLTSSFVCGALAHAAWATGSRLLLADIEEGSRNLDPVDVSNRWPGGGSAIIVPHMFGQAARMDELSSLGYPVVEDCAMGFGGQYGDRAVGSLGEVSICSFYATKLLTTGGEGGMLLTDSEASSQAARGLREYDGLSLDRGRHNYKMTDVAAAIGRVQLRRLPEFIERRREIARQYDELFSSLDVELPSRDPGHVYFRYVVRMRNPDKTEAVLKKMADMGVGAMRPVNCPLHRLLGEADASFPETEKAFRADLSVPIYPSLTDEEIEQVAAGVTKCLKETA